jgi:hypothetical protein
MIDLPKTRNKVVLEPVTAGQALDLVTRFFGDYAPEVHALAPQLAVSRNLRALAINNYRVMLGGVVPLSNGSHEGWLLIDPHKTFTPCLMILAVRRLRFALDEAARGRHVIVHTRTDAGRRLAQCFHMRRLRMIRVHGHELEVWDHELHEGTDARVHAAEKRGAEGGDPAGRRTECGGGRAPAPG